MSTTQNMLQVSNYIFSMKINMFLATAFFPVEFFLYAHFLCIYLTDALGTTQVHLFEKSPNI